MTKVVAENHSIAAGRDVNIKLTIIGGQFDSEAVLEKVANLLGISIENLTSLNFEPNSTADLSELVRQAVFQHDVLALADTGKFSEFSKLMNSAANQIGEVKDKGFEAEAAIRAGNYEAAHVAVECILDSKIVPKSVKQRYIYEFFLTGFLYLANKGHSEKVTSLYRRAQSEFARDLDPKLLVLLEEMQQEVATRDIDSAPLNENLISLDLLLQRDDLTSDDRHHAMILKALCLRRLGERGQPDLLLKSISLHEALLLDDHDRKIEVTNNLGIALIRYFEATGDSSFLDRAATVLGALTPPIDGIRISEYQCYPKVLKNLGNVSKQRILAFRQHHHLGDAIECYVEAERYWNEGNAPYEWAMLQKNKAQAKLFYMETFGAISSMIRDALEDIDKSLRYRTMNGSSWQNNNSIEVKRRLQQLA